MAQVIQDSASQNVQASNPGGAQAFGQQPIQQNTQGNQGIDFNQQTTSGGQGQQPSSNKPKGTGFTNVNTILNANQGNQLGKTIQSGITNTAQGVKQDINNAQNEFNTGVQANTFGSDDNSNVQNIVQNASGLQAGQSVDPNQLSQFQKYTAGGFGGPTSLQNADFLQGQAQQAEQLGQQVGTSGGQQNLLQRFVGNNQYGQGQKTLDQLLLGQDQNSLNQAQASTFGLQNQALGANTNAQQIANQAIAGNQAFGKQALLAAQNAQNPINQNISDTLKSDINQANQQQYGYNNLQKLLGETATQYNSDINAQNAANPSAQSAGTGNPAVDQINAILANLQGAGIDQDTLNQLAGPVLSKNIVNGNAQGYLDQLKQNISYNNPTGLAFADPSKLGTLDYNPSDVDVNSMQNRQAVMDQNQVAQLNALSQLAGGTGNLNASGVGGYKAGGDVVNLNSLLGQNAQQTVGGGPSQSQGPSPIQVGGSALSNVANTLTGTNIPGDFINQTTDAAQQASQGNFLGAGKTLASTPTVVGQQLVNQVSQNPLSAVPFVGGALGNQIGNPLSQITNPIVGVGSNLMGQITNPIASVFGGGGGGGGTIICNELHRQGYMSDEILALDEQFGKQFRKLHPEVYLGYLTVARPVVKIMKKSKLFTVIISKIGIPWSKFMANQMDKTIQGSILGKSIHNICMVVLPIIYKINKVKREYSSI